MPTTKIYDIVTNDKYEFPVAHDCIGAKGVAAYIGIGTQTVRKYISQGKWGGKYKAVQVGIKKPMTGMEKWRRYEARKAVRNV